MRLLGGQGEKEACCHACPHYKGTLWVQMKTVFIRYYVRFPIMFLMCLAPSFLRFPRGAVTRIPKSSYCRVPMACHAARHKLWVIYRLLRDAPSKVVQHSRKPRRATALLSRSVGTRLPITVLQLELPMGSDAHDTRLSPYSRRLESRDCAWNWKQMQMLTCSTVYSLPKLFVATRLHRPGRVSTRCYVMCAATLCGHL